MTEFEYEDFMRPHLRFRVWSKATAILVTAAIITTNDSYIADAHWGREKKWHPWYTVRTSLRYPKGYPE